MTLVWHLFRKDLRHSWMYAAVATAIFLLASWNFQQILTASRLVRSPHLGVQFGAELLTVIGWEIFCAVLLLAEPLTGERAYWFTRPIRWQTLLQAKSLLALLAIAAPVILVHGAIVAANGLPLWEALPGLIWNAILLAIGCLIPVGVIACISRNLQQFILWALGCSASVIFLREMTIGVSYEMYSLSQSLTVLFILLAGAAILVWQYRARQTRLGRIAAIAYFAIVVLLGHLPMSVWYAIQHAMSPQSVEADVARFQPAIPKFDWNRPVSDNGTLTVPLEIQGLPAGWSVELNGWNGHQVSSAGDPDTIGMLLTAPNLTGQDANREAKLIVSGGFARRHRTDSVDLSIQTEVTIYGPPVTYALPVDTQQFIPGVGRCTAASSPFLYLGCQAAVEPEYRVDARWAIDSSSGKPLVLISHVEDRSPIRLVPTLKPIFSMTGGFGAQSDYTKGHINITLRKPVAHVQRTLAVSGRFFEKN